MEQQESGGGLMKSTAVAACTAMAVFYVAILYSPTLILRLPPPGSFKSFMIRRFVCAAVCSVVSIIVCFFILPIRGWNTSNLLGVYGIRADHIWQALIYPLSLTSFMYTGSFALKLLSTLEESKEYFNSGGNISVSCIKSIFMEIIDGAVSITSNVSFWRNYIVAPLTEELVFRACMIPLLLCGGFSTYGIIFSCPVFLVWVNQMKTLHLFGCSSFEPLARVLSPKKLQLAQSLSSCFQLGYTVIFGAYASFLLVRTGHLTAPLIAHMFCNFMGLPVIISRKSGIATLAFVIGMLGFFWMLFPFTSPNLYNYRTDNCRCWHRYCNWR